MMNTLNHAPLLSHRPASISPPRSRTAQFSLAVADERDRAAIARLRHEVYARELEQHAVNDSGQLQDALDGHNVFLVARAASGIAGFVSLTPPGAPSYSVDKYFARAAWPFPTDGGLFEIRLLTVIPPHRGRELIMLLMYGALRWVEAHGGTRVVAIGRHELVPLYTQVGLRCLGPTTRAGAVTYDLMLATTRELRARVTEYAPLISRLEVRTDWRLPCAFRQPAPCFHGGAFFTAIGDRFNDLDRRHTIINADVLDAWFPPAPAVLMALQEHLPWLARTSPPTGCEGLIATLATVRGVPAASFLPGAGSSDLIFRALRHWLQPSSRVLILDPTYGEYAHVLEKVIGCTVDRLALVPEEGFAVNVDRLERALANQYDLVVLVNPNSPTGRHLLRAELEPVLRRAPAATRIWVDETYIEYAGSVESLETFAAQSANVIVCKSMSKVYALSGLRVAYLCASPPQLEALRAITPPWVVGLPAQVAAVRALESPAYYAARYAETATLREPLAADLRSLGWNVLPGVANFLLCHLPPAGPAAGAVVQRCAARGLFLRDAATMSPRLGAHWVRVAVKDAATNQTMLGIIGDVLGERTPTG